MAKKGALPEDAPDRVTLKPKLLDRHTEHRLSTGLARIHEALETLIETILEDPSLRAGPMNPDLLELARVDPGYDAAIQVARFDGLLHEGTLRLLEFNCDSPGGAARADTLDQAYRTTTDTFPSMDLPTPRRSRERVRALEHALRAAYASWRGEKDPAQPRVVLTDWSDVGSRVDIDLTVEAFKQRGLDATFADPRDFELDGDTLVFDGKRVDLVYKRVILDELLADPDAHALLTAYEQGTVCMINPPRSILAGDKRAMAELFDPAIQDELTPAQRKAVQRHVPYTRVLEDATVERDGDTMPLRDLVLSNKDGFVLKAAEGYGGGDVHLGFETSDEDWGRLVDTHLPDRSWVVQELEPIPTSTYPMLDAGRLEETAMRETVNPFVFGGAYAGSYTRISRNARVNVSRGGAICPTLPA